MCDENPYAAPKAFRTNVAEGNAIIRVTRTTSYADRIRAYRIVIDGQEVARVRAGQSVDIPATLGAHTVVARVDWCGSPTLNCNTHQGEVIQLECGSNLRGLRVFLAIVYTLFLHNQYLTLVRV